ncbi:MAG: hypothetical protein DDG59_05135 [Anaerolineae bacterium]|jgi:type II secretory pathway pseudopilin PulG|nr:MAG: hypothetical protein DDG59_05135 [Anaerolineae bacterium]
MRLMQNTERDPSHSKESLEPHLPSQIEQENPPSSTASPPGGDALAATQVHSTTPSESLATDWTAQADPFAETRAVNLHSQSYAANDAGLDATVASRVHLSQPPQGQPEQADGLAATLPTRLAAAARAEQAESEDQPSELPLSTELGLLATQAPAELVGDGTPPPPGALFQSKGKASHPLRWVMLIGIIGLIAIAFLSAFAGYASGIQARKAAAATQAALMAQEQYELALQEIAAKDYERARQRLEYVIQVAPNYPGAADKLAEVIFEASITATPTVAPSPTVSPTPDLRSAGERLEAAKQQIFNSQWQAAIDTLLLLRKAEPNFQPAVVDGLLYLAYRNSGRDKILKEANLEGGIYDLTLAEKFGPLDTETKGLQNWARLYLLGASYWDVDWGQVVYYFAQVAPAVPNLRDGSGWTATDRYRIALGKYAEQLLARKEWCAAMEIYQQALSYGGDQALQEGYNRAYDRCIGEQIPPTETAPPAEVPTQTPEP